MSDLVKQTLLLHYLNCFVKFQAEGGGEEEDTGDKTIKKQKDDGTLVRGETNDGTLNEGMSFIPACKIVSQNIISYNSDLFWNHKW